MTPALSLYVVPAVPLIEPGTDLAPTIADGIERAGLEPRAGDIIAIAQKIVSKADGRLIDLNTVTPSARALELADQADKDPRVVEVILSESRRVVRHRPGVIIVEHRLGLILANAGIDRSNVGAGDDVVLLLPEDPDRSARQLRQRLEAHFKARLGVLITDSLGRPWRMGTTGVAIGCAGVPVLEDLRGKQDLFGRTLEVSEVATADSIAAACGLLMGEGAEGSPAILVRGLDAGTSAQSATDVLRPSDEDLFR